jgi:hypothetical protein
MQGPKTYLVSDNLPLSSFKRKNISRKVLAHRKKKKIDTVVVDIPDMVDQLASAFEVLVFSNIFPFFSFPSLTISCAVFKID